MTLQQYPGVNQHSDYTEKLEMGYRWYDAHLVNPAFPFGHGLSFTHFKYDETSMKVNQTSRNV